MENSWLLSGLFVFSSLTFLLVICLQIRQHNELLGHLKEMMDRYQQLALRVRWVQLKAEEQIPAEYLQPLEEELFGPDQDRDSTVEEVMGKL